MATPSPQSRALYARVEEVLGPEHADALMTFLPPHPATELATKADIADLKADIKEDIGDLMKSFERLDKRIDDLHHGMWDQMRTYTVATVTALVALAAIFGVFVAVVFG